MSKRYRIIVNHSSGAEVHAVEGKVNAEAKLKELVDSLTKQGKKILSKFVEERTGSVKRTDS
jgi:hypothetical protein